MLFKKDILQGIAAGDITLAFRCWRKPSVKPGSRLRTGAGVLEINAIVETSLRDITDNDAVKAGFPTAQDVRAQLTSANHGDESAKIYRIAFELEGPDPRAALRTEDNLTPTEWSDLKATLIALDQRSRSGKWVGRALELIGQQDGRTAGELADHLHLEKKTVKARIRQLKELGLTESPTSGYRLSKRGRRVVDALLPDL